MVTPTTMTTIKMQRLSSPTLKTLLATSKRKNRSITRSITRLTTKATVTHIIIKKSKSMNNPPIMRKLITKNMMLTTVMSITRSTRLITPRRNIMKLPSRPTTTTQTLSTQKLNTPTHTRTLITKKSTSPPTPTMMSQSMKINTKNITLR